MKFQIKRSQWLRGEGSENSYLLRSKDGKKCCVGFFANACGLNDDVIKNRADLVSINHNINFDENLNKLIIDGILRLNNDISCNIYKTNDDKYLCDGEREPLLATYFKEIDVDVEFVD